MTQLKSVVEPFGEVNVYPAPGNKVRVVATILMEPYKEGAQTGIALDGSGSMRKLYGGDDGSGVVSSIFKKKQSDNEVSPVAQQLCAYLARKIDSDGGTTCVYWASGTGGQQVEVIGDLTADQAEKYVFRGPKEFGTGTYLLPAVRYFVDRFKDAPWGFYIFITDGELFDLEEVKRYSTQLARDVARGAHNPLKFVLIGLGKEINERQMEELDDLDTGTEVDLWDHKLASELRMLQEIFAEVVDKNSRVADNGKILDARGNIVKNYSDTGLPAYLEFELPLGNDYFTLDVNGNQINQPLYDQAKAPPSRVATAAPQPIAAPPIPAPPKPSVPPVPVSSILATPPRQPVAATQEPPDAEILPEDDEMIDDAAKITPSKEEDDDWKKIDLRWAEDKKPGV